MSNMAKVYQKIGDITNWAVENKIQPQELVMGYNFGIQAILTELIKKANEVKK